jgi:hypothetical protein
MKRKGMDSPFKACGSDTYSLQFDNFHAIQEFLDAIQKSLLF